MAKSEDLAHIAPSPIEGAVAEKVEPKKKKKKVKAATETAKAPEAAAAAAAAPQTWAPSGWPFGPGEKLVLALRYGLIEGGELSMSVEEPKVIEGEPVLHYVANIRSTRLLEFFYKIDDTMQSWVGLSDHLPRRQEIRQLETARWGRRIVVFDQKAQMARAYIHATKKSGEVEEIRRDDPIKSWAQDVFGALFFYRFIDDMTQVNFPIHDRFRNWTNELIFMGKEHITVPFGEFDAIHCRMNPRVEGSLAPKGDVEVWFKDDPSHILLQFKARIKVGSITGELRSYEPGHPFSVPPPLMRTPIHLKINDYL